MRQHNRPVIFFDNLDGLRFFAFLSVFFAHSFYSKFEHIQQNSLYQDLRTIGHLGIFGVNFFFVLSGFLITYLLLVEKSKLATINLGKFYVRRVLRIWPLYYLIIFIGFMAVPFIHHHIAGNQAYEEQADLVPFLFFFNNMVDNTPSSAVLGVLWSIAIEEQFYLFWPLLILAVPVKRLQGICLLIILISAIYRSYSGYGYMDTFACMSDFAVGGLLAYQSKYPKSWIKKAQYLPQWKIILIYLLGFSLFFVRPLWNDIAFLYNNERLLFSLFFAFVILEQNNCKFSVLKWGNFHILSKLGTYTYGLYMYHFVAIYIVSMVLQKLSLNVNIYQVLIIEPLTGLLLSIVFAVLSYHYFEYPFLKLKSKFSQIKTRG